MTSLDEQIKALQDQKAALEGQLGGKPESVVYPDPGVPQIEVTPAMQNAIADQQSAHDVVDEFTVSALKEQLRPGSGNPLGQYLDWDLADLIFAGDFLRACRPLVEQFDSAGGGVDVGVIFDVTPSLLPFLARLVPQDRQAEFNSVCLDEGGMMHAFTLCMGMLQHFLGMTL